MPTATALPRILVLGSINHDVTARTDRLPGPGETIGDGVLSAQPGGKGANQAVAAARLGAPTRMVGAVGTDSAGQGLVAALAEAGVGTDDVARVSAPTGTALIVVDAAGENQIAVCAGANGDVRLPSSGFGGSDVLLAQLEIPLDVVVAAASAFPGYVALNAAPARSLPSELIDRADLVIVNETEYAAMPEVASARRVVVTYGGDGAALVEHGVETLRVPAYRTEVVNSVGAGDAFCAALTLSLAAGLPADQSLRLAAAVGSDAVSHEASQPPLQSWDDYRRRTSAG
ncbi:ribokinase [Oerskovia sp. NPDC057915]|uniref:ribokinase n=1 Tax=Oerskovia sp. NPDC057915 TaxID=3346280 RepID=UPI0036DB544E